MKKARIRYRMETVMRRYKMEKVRRRYRMEKKKDGEGKGWRR